jgi:hypothetical protein
VPRSKKQSRAIPLLSLRAFVAYKKGETYLLYINSILLISLISLSKRMAYIMDTAGRMASV